MAFEATNIEVKRVGDTVRIALDDGGLQGAFIYVEATDVQAKLLRPVAECAWEIIKETAVPLLEAFIAIFKPEEAGDAATEDSE